MDVKPQTTGQLREILRELAGRKPGNEDELAHLQRGSLLLALHIQGSSGLGTNMPDVAWHFLSDADIRYKSPEYGHAQIAELKSALVLWESEEKLM
ncbi:MAG TPA: hypothetical protein VGI53_15300 [Dyella sp.]|jgi:hypothetical protein